MNSEISYLLLGEPLARCKCVLEMYLQLVNIIIRETLKNLVDFFPFDGMSPRVLNSTPAVFREM